MATAYRIDWNSYHNGETLELAPRAGMPRGYTRQAPPVLGVGEYAVWGANGWVVVTEPPPERPMPAPVPNPLGFRNAMIDEDGPLLLIYSDIIAAAMSNVAVSTSFNLVNESLWNEPWKPTATQAAINALVNVYPFNDEQKTVLEEAFTRFNLPLVLPADI